MGAPCSMIIWVLLLKIRITEGRIKEVRLQIFLKNVFFPYHVLSSYYKADGLNRRIKLNELRVNWLTESVWLNTFNESFRLAKYNQPNTKSLIWLKMSDKNIPHFVWKYVWWYWRYRVLQRWFMREMGPLVISAIHLRELMSYIRWTLKFGGGRGGPVSKKWRATRWPKSRNATSKLVGARWVQTPGEVPPYKAGQSLRGPGIWPLASKVL